MGQWRFRDETRELDDAVRREAPGAFVALSDGLTHYEVSGSPTGAPVVLVHGFSVPYYIWDPTATALTGASFRVLRYDLLGRGYSDHPDVVYDAALFCRQLRELLSALRVGPPVHLVGLSMGGAIAVAFADAYPDLVTSLALIDPAGMPMRMSLGNRLVRAPLLGEWFMDRFGSKMLTSGLARDFHNAAAVAAYREEYLAQMSIVGFRRALLSTLRAGLLGNQQETYRRVGQDPRPVLLVWGSEDTVVPFRISDQVRSALPRAEFHTIDAAGHIPHYERPNMVNPLLIEFLGRQTGRETG